MNEDTVYKILENITPLLLTVIIISAIIYSFIKFITSPFSKIGNFLLDKSSKFFDKINQTRKAKLEEQLKLKKVEISELKNKYINNTKKTMEMKDKLNELSKIFSVLNESELSKNILDKNLNENEKEIKNLKENMPQKYFAKISTKIKIKKLEKKHKRIEKNKNISVEEINKRKQLVKDKLNEL
jgi:hypothetical protein